MFEIGDGKNMFVFPFRRESKVDALTFFLFTSSTKNNTSLLFVDSFYAISSY